MLKLYRLIALILLISTSICCFYISQLGVTEEDIRSREQKTAAVKQASQKEAVVKEEKPEVVTEEETDDIETITVSKEDFERYMQMLAMLRAKLEAAEKKTATKPPPPAPSASSGNQEKKEEIKSLGAGYILLIIGGSLSLVGVGAGILYKYFKYRRSRQYAEKKAREIDDFVKFLQSKTADLLKEEGAGPQYMNLTKQIYSMLGEARMLISDPNSGIRGTNKFAAKVNALYDRIEEIIDASLEEYNKKEELSLQEDEEKYAIEGFRNWISPSKNPFIRIGRKLTGRKMIGARTPYYSSEQTEIIEEEVRKLQQYSLGNFNYWKSIIAGDASRFDPIKKKN